MDPRAHQLTVFISYRRQDASGHAGRLADGLISLLGREQVFVDVDSIDPGQDFVAAISDAVNRSDALLVVIGRSWLTASTEKGVRRLDDPQDFVRLEIESALQGEIRIVPVLVHGASMPTADDLPEPLQTLCRCNAVVLHDTQWVRDLDHLVSKLGATIAQQPGRDAPARQAPIIPPQRTLTTPPALLDRTIGRETELASLQQLVMSGESRLITILGPGGVGKTRLVTELGHRLVNHFNDVVAFVPLADAQRPTDVAPIICAALGLPIGEGGALATLENRLRERHMLLVCDNFEHVVEAAPVLTELLAVAREMSVIVTSRQQLGVRGEHQFRLDPLSHDDSNGQRSPAVALFLARAHAADPDFAPTPDELTDIALICARCDGLPLAVELAAARTRVLTIAELRDRMSHSLPVLDSGSRDAPARHRTLRASIAWSVEALDEGNQRFLKLLSVFNGGFTVAAAAAITDTAVDHAVVSIESLLARSLVHRRSRSGGRFRFDLLETVREYLAERIEPDVFTRAHRRHAEYFRHMMGTESPVLSYTDEGWAAQLPERPNIRAAIRWARQAGDSELFADLVFAASHMWHWIGPRDELQNWLRQVIADHETPTGRRVDALQRLSAVVSEFFDNDAEGSKLLAEAEATIDDNDTRRQVSILTFKVVRAVITDVVPDNVVEQLERAKYAIEAAGNPIDLRCNWLSAAAILAQKNRDYASALQSMDLLLQQSRADNLAMRSTYLHNACELALEMGDYAKAVGWAEEGMRHAKAAEDVSKFAGLVGQRGVARLQTGDLNGANADLLMSLELCAQEGDWMAGLEAVQRLAACHAKDRPKLAAVLVGAFEAGTVAASAAWLAEQPVVRQLRGRYLADLPSRLGAEYDAAWSAGCDLAANADGTGGVLAEVLKTLSVHNPVS